MPLLVISLAARGGHLALAPRFEWIASDPALATLAVAGAVEVVAYFVPWLDNLLDALAGPAAVVAGVVATASVITAMEPWLRWTLAVVAGGGAAGSVQALTTGVRGVSTLSTGGLANPLLSAAEAAGSILLSLLAVVAPLAALVLLAVLAGVAWRRWATRRRPARA